MKSVISAKSVLLTCNSTELPLQIKPEAFDVERTTLVFVNTFALTLVLKLIAFAPAYFENILSRNMNKI